MKHIFDAEIRNIIADSRLDIVGISETGLKPTISSECVKIKGYICLGLLIIRSYKGGVAMDLMSVCLLILSFFSLFSDRSCFASW